ncbi:MAG: substrate-binding domain-containing protein [Janthinobacterium lividum]
MMLKQIFLAVAVSFATAVASGQTLHVYGPGGPLAPLKECAELYTRTAHKSVIVTGGPEAQWITAAEADADLIYGGAEYMLTDFDQHHPGLLQPGSRTELYARAAGVLVRKGNPKHIQSLADLVRPGIRILDVNGAGQVGLWEDLAGKEDLIAGIQQHIAVSVTNSADAIKQWNANGALDAWITYVSWQKRLPDTTEVVPLAPEALLHRGTPIALTSRTAQKQAAAEFLRFLQTDQAHAIFIKWGWK